MAVSTTPVDMAALARRADTQLSRLERSKMEEFLRALRTSQNALQNEFARRWPDDEDLTQGGAIGRARADIILQQTGGLIELIQNRLNGLAEGIASSGISDAWQQGIDGALDTLFAFDTNAYQSALAALNVQGQIDTRSMTQAMQGMRDNLKNWTSEFIGGAQDAVIQSLVSGKHTSAMSFALAEQFATTRYKVDRVLRTELHQAQDRARREMYKEANVQYVQRVATQDERVCFWCAERAGHVYRIDEAPASLHPFDRCFNMPWNPIWAEEGLIDEDWVNEHSRETQKAYNRQVEERRAAGQKVTVPEKGSRAPFDPPGGPPQPIWVPQTGFTKFGKSWLRDHPPFMPPRDDGDSGAPPPPPPPGSPPPPPEPPPTPPSAAPTTVSPSQADVTGYLREKDAYMAFQDADLTELSAEDRKLILKYQSWDYDELNSYLRGESATLEGWTMEEVERLRELVTQDVVPEDMLSFRLFGLQGDKIPDDLSAMIGTTIENPHFVSTSIREDFPNAIIDSRIGEPGEVSVLTTIKVPAGTRGLYADLPFEWIDDPDEWAEMMVDDMPGVMHELILPPGTNFRIVGAEWEYKGSTLRLTVELEQPSFAQTPTFASPEAARQFYRDTLISEGIPASQADRLAKTMAGITDDVVPTVPVTPIVQEPVVPDTPISVRDAAPREWGVSEKSTREWFDYQGEDIYYILDDAGNLEIAQRYTGNGHKEINAALRQGGDIPPHLQAEVSVLDDLFATEEATAPESYTLYRAFSHPTGQIAMDPDKMVGTILYDRGFMSTSYDLDAVDRYFLSTAPKDHSEASFLVEIRTRAGQPAIGMEHISGLHEGEVLLPRGTALQIVESRWVEQPNGEGYWHLITEPTSAPTSEPLFMSWKTPAS